jgi:hypothetical protein
MTLVAQASPRTVTTGRALLTVAAWLILLVALGRLTVQAWPHPPYTVDSWGYYELSRHLGTHFFRINTWRGYQSDIPYGISFGPMWPVTIKIVGLLTHVGVRAGLVAAVGCVIATAVALTGFARRAGLHPALGPVVGLGLLAFQPYTDEVMAARSFPLALMLLSVLLWLACGSPGQEAATGQRPATGQRAAAAGVVAAMIVLTRTDLLLAMVLLGGVLLGCRRLPWSAAAGFAIAMLPWVGFSFFHFGTPLASDNVLVSEAVPRLHSVMVLDPATVPTVADHPAAWLARVAGNAGPVLIGWVQSLATVPLLVTLLAGLAAWAWRRPAVPRLPLLLLGCLLVQTAVGQMTTGYRDARYLSGALLFALVVGVGAILGRATAIRRAAGGGTAVGLALLLAAGSVAYRAPSGGADAITGGVAEAGVRRCHDRAATLLTTPLFGAQHGALTGLPTAILPLNFRSLNPSELRSWLERYGILQLYEPPDTRFHNAFTSLRRQIGAVATLVPDPCTTVGRLDRIELNP